MINSIWQLPAGKASLLYLAFILLLAVFGPSLAPYDPLIGTEHLLAHPSTEYWLGTDYLGRDVLSRILAGSTISVLGSVQVALIAMLVGAIPGVLSVYLGRSFEWLTMRRPCWSWASWSRRPSTGSPERPR
jgi:peptide/nickel transport system permease protein